MNTPNLIDLKFKSVKHFIEINYPEFYNYLNEHYPKDITFPEKVYWYYHNINNPPMCTCGNRLKFKTLFAGYHTYCSVKCKNDNFDEIKIKIRKTSIERYGTDNPFASEEIKEKIRQTNLKKYGNIIPMRSKEIKEKLRQTNLKKYGCTCSLHNKDVHKKTLKTWNSKYGVDSPFDSEEIKEKIRQTNLKRYGDIIPMRSDKIKNKVLNKYKEQFLNNHPDIKDVIYNGGQSNSIYICKCNNNACDKCQEKQFKIDSLHYWIRKNNNIQLCTKLHPIQKYRSEGTSLEIFIRQILDKYNISYITNDRSILNDKELDIYIPNKRIAIECNGVYWHSDRHKSKNYHFDKFKECNNNGVRLLHIWEDQYINNKNIVESIILSKIGLYDKRIYARKCEIKYVDNETSKHFLNENHIQGNTSSSVKLGLYYKDELVSIMTFSRRKSGVGKYQKDNSWELSRFCNKLNTQVIGGASKLFRYFVNNYDFNNIISYASHDISNGEIYNILGFKEDSISKTSYWYIDKNNMKRYHRLNFSKKQLIKKGYSKDLTEFQIMDGLNYFRIYDSGQTKYIYTKNTSLA